MYAQTDTNVRHLPVDESTTTPSRATLQTRPRSQRILIRSWEYIRPVRITVLVIRLLVVLWLVILSVALMSAGAAWAAALIPAAVAVFAFSLWVFNTASKGYPVAKA
jgi:hypothetical protein